MSSLQQRCDFMMNVAQHALIMGIKLDEFQKLAIAAYGVLERPAPETPVVVGVDFAKAGSDSTVFWCPKCQQQLPSADVIHDCPTPNR